VLIGTVISKIQSKRIKKPDELRLPLAIFSHSISIKRVKDPIYRCILNIKIPNKIKGIINANNIKFLNFIRLRIAWIEKLASRSFYY
jgi:hypothetical protein